MYDIIAIGDSTVDVFLKIHEANVMCNLDTEACQLCVSYADKIPVDTMKRMDAVGNAANHAVGVSRLGFKAAIVTIIGSDDSGRAIMKKLKEEKVSTEYVTVDKKQGTNYSTVLNYRDERTILVYHEHRDYAWKNIGKAKWIYFTSMGEGSESLHPELLRYIEKTGAKLAVNPGSHQLRSDGKVLGALLAKADVIFVNKEEAKRILHDEEKNHIGELLEHLRALGPKIAVITDGQKGSYAYDGTAKYYLGIFDTPVVERTGCGDAFGSGFTAALARGYTVTEAMRWGNINASGVIQYIGAQEGLHRKADLEKILKEHPEYQASTL